jgi:ElaB/YqjD/DUF883 family membrane-anchored ribosome-binding protein
MTNASEQDASDSEAKQAFSSDLESLKKSFAQLRTDLTGLVSSALGAGKTSAHIVKEQAAAAADGVKHKLHDLKDHGSETAQAFERKIAERPIASILIAFGVGYVVARMFSRK